MHLSIPAGATSKIIQIPIFDSSSTTGGMLTGLVYNSVGLTAYYNREGAAGSATAITLATATKGTYTSGGFIAVDVTNMPGWYELHIPDAALASGAKSVTVHLKGATNMVPVPVIIELTATSNQDNVRGGMTALPNAAAEATGGLYTRGTGAGQIAQDANGSVRVDVDTIKTRAITCGAGVTVYAHVGTSAANTAQTGDCYPVLTHATYGNAAINTKIGTPAGASVSADIAGIQADTDNIQTRIPATLVGGRMDSAIASTQEDTIVDKVWDEVLTAATHNVSNSAGRRLRQLGQFVIHSATAQAGGTNTITLDTGASGTNNIYKEDLIVITGGTAVGEAHHILEYNGTTKVAVVDENWHTVPDATSEFTIYGASTHDAIDMGKAQAGGANTITLTSSASATNDTYNDTLVTIVSGTGAGQCRTVTAYNGTTKVATVTHNWVTQPDSTSGYIIYSLGRSRMHTNDDKTGYSISGTVTTLDTLQTNIKGTLGTNIDLTKIAQKTTGGAFNADTDSLEALRDRGDSAWITATGFSTHSAADTWAVATRTITGGTIGTYTGNTAQTGDVYALLTGSDSELSSLPTATSSLANKIRWLFQYFKMKRTITSTQEKMYKADGSTVLGTSTVSDDGTTATKGDMA